jgi:deazaflavin-dependent oxidoreductase (nitroreductase family)
MCQPQPQQHESRPPRRGGALPAEQTGSLDGFGAGTHVGRASGRVYHTPINVFRRGDHYLFALTYGSNVDWVKNVVAAGGCDMQTRGRHVKLVEPEVVADPATCRCRCVALSVASTASRRSCACAPW